MRIFHIATAADWEAARTRGDYRTSTVDRTLEDEGFLHAAHRHQVPGVYERYYRRMSEPLVLLTVDTGRLDVPWREDEVGGERYPHIYGPLSTRAVVEVSPLDPHGGTGSFTGLFVTEMLLRVGLALVAMLLAGAGAYAGAGLPTEWGRFVGAVAGLSAGAGLALLVVRRRR